MTRPEALVERIRAAYQGAGLQAFGALLAEDARWGDDDHPNRCRGRADVLRTFERRLGTGVTAEILDARSGPCGALLRLHVTWTDPADRPRGAHFFHVFVVRDGRVTEIRRYDDVSSAEAAVDTA